MNSSVTRGGIYRYTLTRGPDALCTRLLYIMLNPSTADAFQDDRTVGRCYSYSFANGFAGAFSIGNLYAFRTPMPRDLWGAWHDGVDIIGPENDEWLSDMAGKAETIVLAWGHHPRAAERGSNVLYLLRRHVRKFHVLGRTKDGYPRHPLYLQRDLKFAPWSLATR